MTKQELILVASVFVVLACFKAWKRERDKNDDAGNRRFIDDELGQLHKVLVDRIATIRETSPLFYYEKYPECLYPTRHDPDTSAVLFSINDFLSDKISKSAAEIFNNQKGMKHTPNTISDPKWQAWQDVIDMLCEHESQMNEIMMARLQNRL